MTGIHFAVIGGYPDAMCDVSDRPLAPEANPFSVRMPRPLWIVLTTVILVAIAASFRLGVQIQRQRTAIRGVQRFGGQVTFSRRSPEWLNKLGLGWDLILAIEEVERVTFPVDVAKHVKLYHFYFGFDSGAPMMIDNDRLDCLMRFPRLKGLVLSCTNVGDDAMATVARLDELEELQLDGMDVSDASLPFLVRLKRLKKLGVSHTRITEAGIAQLERELPKLNVLR